MHDATYDSTFFKVWGTSNWTILILLLGRLINYMSPWKLAMYGYYGSCMARRMVTMVPCMARRMDTMETYMALHMINKEPYLARHRN